MKDKLPASIICSFDDYVEITESPMIYIIGTENIMAPSDAKKFLKDHVVVRKSDVERLKKFLADKGLKKEFEAFTVYPLASSK